MKLSKSVAALSLSTMFMLGTSTAHDPSMHQEQPAEKPKCEMMKGMDHSKMKKDDPVMQAMMKKCMNKDSAEGQSEVVDDTVVHTADDSSEMVEEVKQAPAKSHHSDKSEAKHD